MTRAIIPYGLVVLIVLQALSFGDCQFCTNTLSRSTCPELKTFDAVDLEAYSGSWYEIGSNAFFKNLQEAGGICVRALYTPASDSVVVFNSQTRVIGSLGVSLVQRISSKAAGICAEAREICEEIHTGTVWQGLYSVETVAKNISESNPDESAKLLEYKSTIEIQLSSIDAGIDMLAKNVSEIQLLNADLSQAVGETEAKVSQLTDIAVHIDEGIIDPTEDKLSAIAEARKGISSVAGELYTSESTKAFGQILFQAVSLIQNLEENIPGPAATIKSTLGSAAATASSFVYDTSRPIVPVNITGKAVQNSTEAGKLSVSFGPMVPPARYWILDLVGEASAGYEAAMIYGCDELPTGGVYQPFFILSRKPTLDQKIIDKFLDSARSLGIYQECAEVFALSEQPASCEYPSTS